jgi:hypothetical protein
MKGEATKAYEKYNAFRVAFKFTNNSILQFLLMKLKQMII